MFKFLTPLLLLFLIFGAAKLQAQNVLLNSFELQADGADIMISWEIQDEKGVAEYRIFRRFEDQSTLTHVVTLPNNKQSYYTYLDNNIFKQQPKILYYELQIVVNGQIQKFSQSLSHNPTSIQRTWGSIKSMFRD
ncbi:MAG: hypothetical protein MRZ79_21425 [Bacteroidia bacterium]|nr:hypothetical protein [Bacteroidia bacterium]